MNKCLFHCRRRGVVFAACVLTAALHGCESLDDGLVGLLREPPAIIVQNVFQPTLSRTLTVDLRDYVDANRISWDFGDGSRAIDLTVAMGRTVTHSFPSSGTFVVQVYIFGPTDPIQRGREKLGTGSLPIEVVGPNLSPQARIRTTPLRDETGALVPRGFTFDGTTSTDPENAIAEFMWDFGDGTPIRTGSVVQHTYALSGQFTVRLTVVDDRGASDTVVTTVTANILPTASFTANEVAGSDGRAFRFDATASTDPDGSISSYEWDFGDQSAAGSGEVVQHTYAVPGEYEVTLTITDNLGGTATTSQIVDATGDAPFVSSITPVIGEVNKVVSVTISGFNFSDGMTARLTRVGTPDIVAISTTFVTDQRLLADFDLTGAATGLRDLVVRDTTAQTTTLDDAFTVVTANRVRMTTSLGDIVLELDPVRAPITVANFFRYAEELRYDGTVFHRVVNTPEPFVIQGGGFESLGRDADPRLQERDALDPIESEANNGLSNIRGTIAMALRGQNANSATSQFFINLGDNSFLDTGPPPFTVFGQVVEGLDVVDAIAAVEVGSANVLDADGNTVPVTNVPVLDVTIITVRRE